MLFSFHSNYGTLREIAKRIGFGEHTEVKLSRLDMADAGKGTQSFGINPDFSSRTPNAEYSQWL